LVVLATPPLPASASEFIVFELLDDANDPLPGSLRQRIPQLNLQDDEESFFFFDMPNNAPILLEDVLPDIEQNVEFVGDPIFGGTLRKVDDEATFDILRISKGTTMLDGVELLDGPVTVGIDADEGSDARLGFRYEEGTVVVFEEDITGLGGVIKQGLGELRLKGENSFTAGLFVEEGQVSVDEESLPGDAAVEEDALLVFTKFDAGIDDEEPTTPEIYAGTVTGDGRIQKLGQHDLSLTGGGFLQTGGTEIVNGSISTNPARFPGDVTIGRDANLVMNLGTDQVWSGNASGDGAIAKYGAGTLQLDGVLSNTGGLFVGSGGVAGSATSLPPRVELATALSSRLDFLQASDATYTGQVSGEGAVTKSGAGTLTLTGANTWSGGTTIDEGRLRGTLSAIPGDVDIAAPSSSLELVVDGTSTLGGSLTGSGTFVKTGAGLLTIDASQAGFAGSTQIETGTLELTSTGVLGGAGTVTVASGATLQGEGRVGGPLDVRGLLRPGAGVGTGLDAGGNVLLAAGSTLAVEVQNDGASHVQSQLSAVGQTTLSGGTVDVAVLPGQYAAVQIFQVIQSGSITQTAPIALTPIYAFVDVTSRVSGANLEISVLENGANAATFAETQNQFEVAVALDEMLAVLPPDDELRRSLVSVTADDLPPLLDDMSAAALSMLFTQRIESGRRFSRAVARRFGAGRYEDSPPAPKRRAPAPVRRQDEPVDRLHESSPEAPTGPAAPGQPVAPVEPAAPSGPEAPTPQAESVPPPGQSVPPVGAAPTERAGSRHGSYRDPISSEGGLGIWGDVFGVFGRIDGGEQSEDVKTRLYGATLGLDYRLPDGRLVPRGHQLRFGGALDYGRAAPSGDRGRTEATANLVLIGAHASWTYDAFYAGVVGRYGHMNGESQRRMVFGDIDDTATGEFDGHEGGIYTEAGARFGLEHRLYLQPRLGFEWTRLSQSGFTESGAPDLDLVVGASEINSLRTFIGANLGTQMTLRGRFGIEPEIRLGWGYEFGDIDRLIDARFTGAAGGGAFSSTGARTSRHDVLFGAGYTMRVAEGVAIALDYDARMGSKQAAHSIGASAYVQW